MICFSYPSLISSAMAASFASEFHLSQCPVLTVMRCSYSFFQPTNVKGRPKAGVRSGLIRITLLGADNGVLTNWATDPMKAAKGKIIFKDLTGGTLRTLYFEDTYCVDYVEDHAPGTSGVAYVFELGLSARRITIDTTKHDNMWLDWKPDA